MKVPQGISPQASTGVLDGAPGWFAPVVATLGCLALVATFGLRSSQRAIELEALPPSAQPGWQQGLDGQHFQVEADPAHELTQGQQVGRTPRQS